MNEIGTCNCTKCEHSMPCPIGIDCSQIKCPKCQSSMRNGGYDKMPLK